MVDPALKLLLEHKLYGELVRGNPDQDHGGSSTHTWANQLYHSRGGCCAPLDTYIRPNPVGLTTAHGAKETRMDGGSEGAGRAGKRFVNHRWDDSHLLALEADIQSLPPGLDLSAPADRSVALDFALTVGLRTLAAVLLQL